MSHHYGRAFEELLHERDISITEAAKKLGVTTQGIYSKFGVERFRKNTLHKILHAFGISEQEFLEMAEMQSLNGMEESGAISLVVERKKKGDREPETQVVTCFDWKVQDGILFAYLDRDDLKRVRCWNIDSVSQFHSTPEPH